MHQDDKDWCECVVAKRDNVDKSAEHLANGTRDGYNRVHGVSRTYGEPAVGSGSLYKIHSGPDPGGSVRLGAGDTATTSRGRTTRIGEECRAYVRRTVGLQADVPSYGDPAMGADNAPMGVDAISNGHSVSRMGGQAPLFQNARVQ